jgi:hypothetical protein
MLAFEIYVNRIKVCTAGLEELAAVKAGLTSFLNQDDRPDKMKIRFTVGGMKDKKYYHWLQYEIQKGHRIEIRIVDAKKTDDPKELPPTGCCGSDPAPAPVPS